MEERQRTDGERSYRDPWCGAPGLAALQPEQAVSDGGKVSKAQHLLSGQVSQGNPTVLPPPPSCSSDSHREKEAGQQEPTLTQRLAKPLYTAP